MAVTRTTGIDDVDVVLPDQRDRFGAVESAHGVPPVQLEDVAQRRDHSRVAVYDQDSLRAHTGTPAAGASTTKIAPPSGAFDTVGSPPFA
jgi:hypothetical protein